MIARHLSGEVRVSRLGGRRSLSSNQDVIPSCPSCPPRIFKDLIKPVDHLDILDVQIITVIGSQSLARQVASTLFVHSDLLKLGQLLFPVRPRWGHALVSFHGRSAFLRRLVESDG